MTCPAANLTWQNRNSSALYTAQWNEDCVVYNPLSGETHQLNLMALDALQFLQHAATLQMLTEHICMLYQTDDTTAINQQMLQLIEQFDELGLISVCPT
jgi:PqqD family protein of HPr-rel-A system